jgi:hypothetical protein
MDIRQWTSANKESIRAEDEQAEATDIDEALRVEEAVSLRQLQILF